MRRMSQRMRKEQGKEMSQGSEPEVDLQAPSRQAEGQGRSKVRINIGDNSNAQESMKLTLQAGWIGLSPL